MYWIFDVIAILVPLVFIIGGLKKGAVMMILSLAGLIAAFFLAGIIRDSASEPLYSRYIKPKIIDEIREKSAEASDAAWVKITDVLSDYGIELNERVNPEEAEKIIIERELLTDSLFSDKLNSIISEYFGGISSDYSAEASEYAGNYLKSGAVTAEESLGFIKKDSPLREDFIEREFIRPAAVKVAGDILWLISFMVLSVVFGVVAKLAGGVVSRIPVIGFANRLAGAAVGFVQGVLLLIILCAALNIYISLANDPSSVRAAIDNTHMFKLIYNYFYGGGANYGYALQQV